MMPLDKYSNKPEDSMAFPNTLPPPTKNSVCQDIELKSTSVSIPVLNMIPTNSKEMMEMSPKTSLVSDDVENNNIVITHIANNKVFFLLKLLLVLYVTMGIATRSLGFTMNSISSLWYTCVSACEKEYII